MRDFILSGLLDFSYLTVQFFTALGFTLLVFPYLLSPWLGLAFFCLYIAYENMLMLVSCRRRSLKFLWTPSIYIFLTLLILCLIVYRALLHIKPVVTLVRAEATSQGLVVNGFRIPHIASRIIR